MKSKIDTSKKRSNTLEPDIYSQHPKKKCKQDISGPEIEILYDCSTSSDSDSDTEDELDLPDRYLEEGPYKFFLNENKRGKIGSIKDTPEGIINCPSLNLKPLNNLNYVVNIPVIASEGKKSVTLPHMLQTQSFGKTSFESAQLTQNRMSLVIGVNKLKSVVQENNKVLYDELKSPVTSNFPYKRIGYFWKPQWEMIKPAGYTLNVCIEETLSKKYKSPTLIKDQSSNHVYIYGKWFGEKSSLKCLTENTASELFEKKPLPKTIVVSHTSNPKLFEAIIEVHGHSGKTQPVGLGTVRKWYENSKESDNKTLHIASEEKKPKLMMIPYREIRDTLKDSDGCSGLLKYSQDRALKSDKPTYLMFFDSSIESFRTKEGIGVMSCYDKMIQKYHNKKNSYPVVISTGYRIDSDKYPIESKSIDYDMDVRTKTNKWNENSIYPPEPNFGILPLPYKKIESCDDGEKNYPSPKEAPIMVCNIIKERELNPNEPGIVFKGKHAVQMEIRPRMLGGKTKFNASQVNFRGEILNWNEQFFKSFRNTSQSHFKPLQWANSTLNKYKLMPVILYVDKSGALSKTNVNALKTYTLTENDVKCMLASLLSKLFTAYDPVSICNKISTNDFRDNLIAVLKTYHEIVPYIVENDKKDRSQLLYTNYFDKATKLEEIKHYVCLVSDIVGKSFGNINQAAKSAGLKIYKNIYRDCFSDHPKWVEALLKQFINEFIPSERRTYKITDDTTRMIKAICEDNFFYEDLGNFNMSYLHLAALTGNTNYVDFLLKDSLVDKNIKAMYDILPLHCAIKYYIKHDEDYDFEYTYENDLMLIELLADSENIFYKMANGKSALYVILTELPHPEIVIERLYDKNHIEEYVYKLLIAYTTMLKKNNIPFEAFNNPLIHIIEHIEDVEEAALLIILFVIHGAGIDENHNEDNYADDDSLSDSPLFFAIRRGDFQLIKAISDVEGAFSEVYNHQGLPPLLYAIHKNASYMMLKTLYDCGASLLETNMGQDWGNYTFDPILQTCAIIEIIRPSLGGKRNLALLQYIFANEDIESIMELLLLDNYDEDRSDDEDDEDGSQSVLDILIEEEDIEAIQTIFFNDDMEANEILDRLDDKKSRKILKIMSEMQCESGPGF